MPESWRLGCVGDFAEVKVKDTLSRVETGYEKGNPVIKIKNIVGDGTVDTRNCDCVSENVGEAASSSYAIPKALLIAMTGSHCW